MKIRIQDNSIRFRITLKELDELREAGRIARSTEIPAPNGDAAVFRYAVELDDGGAESRVQLQPDGIILRLAAGDLATLCKPHEEGVYIRREWWGADGSPRRFMAFVEKDRPGATCDKPEAWIYDEVPGVRRETRAIPKADTDG
jgi:hypothetical protein